MIVAGYYGFTLDDDSGGVLRFQVGRPCVCLMNFSFPDDNLSKHQWIFIKLGMCIDIVEIWLGIANGQISSNFDSYLPDTPIFSRFYTIFCGYSLEVSQQ